MLKLFEEAKNYRKNVKSNSSFSLKNESVSKLFRSMSKDDKTLQIKDNKSNQNRKRKSTSFTLFSKKGSSKKQSIDYECFLKTEFDNKKRTVSIEQRV